MNTPTTSDGREAFHEAIDQMDIWKNAEVKAFAVALVAAAVRKLKAGQMYFTTDDVPEEKHPASPGIAGSVIEKLKNASVIKAVGVMLDDPELPGKKKWYADRIRSLRPSSKGRWIGKYELCSLHNGCEFLARNAVAIAGQQMLLMTA